jgi:WD40 repeat protein
MDLAVGGRWHCVLFTPDADPLTQLAQQLSPLFGVPPEMLRDVLTDPARLTELVRSARSHSGAPGRVVLIVDQFEELFTLCQDEDQRSSFVRALTFLTGPPTGEWMLAVLGVRADFYGHVTGFQDLRAAVERPFLVGAMTRAELRQVIEGPARVAGLVVDNALTELLLHDLGDVQGSLPLLSYALLATWQHREGDHLTLTAYYATGGIRGAIAKSADDTYQRFDPASRQVLRRLLLRLVRVDPDNQHTRRRFQLAELMSTVDDPSVTRYVLDQLIRARLVIVDGDAVELAHEALIRAWPRLAGWIDADRAGLLIRQQLSADAEAWERRGEDPAFLHTDSRLADARTLMREQQSTAALGPLEQRFLAASEGKEHRAVRRRKVFVTVLAVISVLAVVATGVALWQRNAVEQQRNEATSRAAAVQVITVLNTDPALAANLALASYRVSPTLEARSALLSASALPRVTRMSGHSGPVTAMATTPGLTIMATTGTDGTARLWDLADKHEIATLSGHKGEVRAAAFGAGGRVLFTGGLDGTVRTWDVANPTKAVPLGEPLRVPGQVQGLVTIPAANLLVAASSTGSIMVWDVSQPQQPKPQGTPSTHDGGASAVAVTPDGSTLATGGHDGSVRLWKLDASRQLVAAAQLTGHRGQVTALAFSPDGKMLASGGVDNTARLWSTDLAAPVGQPLAHRSGVRTVAFSPDGRTLASGSDDHVVNLFDIARGQVRATFPQPETVRAVSFTGDGRLLLTGSDNGMVRAWRLTGPILPGAEPATSVAFSPDGRVLATANGGLVSLWDSSDPHNLRPFGPPLAGHTGPVTALAFSPNGKILATGSADTTVRLWDIGAPGPPRPLGDRLLGHHNPVVALSFSSDGYLLASGSLDTVRLWDVHNPAPATPAGQLPGPGGPVAFHPNQNVLAMADAERNLKLWNVRDPGSPAQLGTVSTGHTGIVTSVAFDQQGRTLASASEDKTVRIWDATQPDHLSELGSPLTSHSGTVQAVRFAATGSTLLSAGQDGNLMVWDLHDRANAVRTAAMFSSSALTGLAAMAVAPDGHTVAVSTANATVVGDIDPEHVAELICATDNSPITGTDWDRYFPNTPERPTCS